MSHREGGTGPGDPGDETEVVRVGLIALFVTALVTAQLTASKVLAFSLPVALPITGDTLRSSARSRAGPTMPVASSHRTKRFGLFGTSKSRRTPELPKHPRSTALPLTTTVTAEARPRDR